MRLSRLYAVLALLLFPVGLFAQDAAPVVTEPQSWVSIVGAIISIVLTTVALPLMKKYYEIMQAKALATQLDARGELLERLKLFAMDQAVVTVERDFPKIIKAAQAGEVTSASIKPMLYEFGTSVKSNAVEYFKREGIDIMKVIGEPTIDATVRWAADRVSPFPGKETAVELVKVGALEALEYASKKAGI